VNDNSEAKYLRFVQEILQTGKQKGDRTGTGTLSVFGKQIRFDLSQGFPLLTTKKINFSNIVHELLWFISGSTSVKYLTDNNVHIWDEWVKADGTIGDGYGRQWRSWQAADGKKIDQLQNVISQIKSNPNSRRLIVSAWNVGEIDNMALPPCHLLFQFYVADGTLSCQLYQRSADVGIGVCYNLASYMLLLMMIASICNLKVGEFIWTGGDCHIYSNHIKPLEIQLSRKPYKLPTVYINKDIKDITKFTINDVILSDYVSHPFIRMDIAV